MNFLGSNTEEGFLEACIDDTKDKADGDEFFREFIKYNNSNDCIEAVQFLNKNLPSILVPYDDEVSFIYKLMYTYSVTQTGYTVYISGEKL